MTKTLPPGIDPVMMTATTKPNRPESVEWRWPFLLPSEWRQRSCGDSEAVYDRRDGLLVLCSPARESDGRHWLHVSMSFRDRMPTYADMVAVKKQFVGDALTAYQLFVPADKHVSVHDYELHLWACVDGPVTPDFSRGNGMV